MAQRHKVVNPVAHVLGREQRGPALCDPNQTLVRNRLASATNLYRKDLYSHFGCVNAIEFSKNGQWLLSGGDDKRVLLWNIETAILKNGSPFAMKAEHSSNIFCMGFDCNNSRLFSAGNDEQMMIHDSVTGENVHTVFHDEAIYGLSVDPINDNIIATACNDGGAFIFDLREAANNQRDAVLTIRSHAAFHAIMHNPVEPRLLTTANTREGVGLWDIRKIREPVIKFTDSANDLQPAMSVRFNIRGTQILALRRRHSAILYNLSSHFPIAEFDDSTYYNSCTMKSCCFAGDDDQYILSGSDDFKLYVWQIPQELMDSPYKRPKKPFFINEAHMRLASHRSIVNQVRYNYVNSMIASSGVEKIIKLWSCFPLPNGKGSLEECDPNDSRKVYSHEDYISLVLHSGQFMSHDYSHQSTQEDPRMMAFFDSLVQRDIEGWTSDSSTDSTDGYTLMTLRSSSSSGSSDSEAVESVLNAHTEYYMNSLLNRIESQNANSSTGEPMNDQSNCPPTNSSLNEQASASSSNNNNNQTSSSPSSSASSLLWPRVSKWTRRGRETNTNETDAETNNKTSSTGENTKNGPASKSTTPSSCPPSSSSSAFTSTKNTGNNKIVNLISNKKIEQLKKTARVVVRSTKKRLKKVKKYCKSTDEKTAHTSNQSEKAFRFQNMNKLTEMLSKRLEQNSNKSIDQSKNKRSKSRRRLRRLTTQSDFILNEVYPGDPADSSTNTNDTDSDSDIGLPDDHLLATALDRADGIEFDDDSDTSSSPGWMTSDDDDETLSSDDDDESTRQNNNLITFGDPNEATSSTSDLRHQQQQQQQQVSMCNLNNKFDLNDTPLCNSNSAPTTKTTTIVTSPTTATATATATTATTSLTPGDSCVVSDEKVIMVEMNHCDLSNSSCEAPGPSCSSSGSSSASSSSSSSSSSNSSSSSSSSTSSSSSSSSSACSTSSSPGREEERIASSQLITSQSIQPSPNHSVDGGERTLLSSQH